MNAHPKDFVAEQIGGVTVMVPEPDVIEVSDGGAENSRAGHA